MPPSLSLGILRYYAPCTCRSATPNPIAMSPQRATTLDRVPACAPHGARCRCRRRFVRPVNAYSLWVGGSVATATSSDNRRIDGSMRMIAAQWTHDLFAWHRARVRWVTEVLSLILVTSGAPPGRIPPSLLDPRKPPNPAQLARYLSHDSKGFGFSRYRQMSRSSERPPRHRVSRLVTRSIIRRT